MSGVKVSTRGDYASRALLSLALHTDHQAPTSVRDIAERTGLPQPYLEQILLALKGAGLVRSKRGVGGGYVLARHPDEISLSDIVSAVDGPIAAGDFEQLRQLGHRMKGVGNSYGFAHVSVIGKHVEDAAKAADKGALTALVDNYADYLSKVSIVYE